MKIRSKILLATCIIAGAFFFMFFLETRHERGQLSFLAQEDKKSHEAVFDKIFKLKGESLDALSLDYTYWDEMVNFMATGDRKWARVNLDVALSTYKVNYIWVYKTDALLLYSVSDEKDAPLKEMPIPKEGIKDLFSDTPFCYFFLNTPSGLLEVRGASIHPTIDPERKTPAEGYFFAARLWDINYLEQLGNLTKTKIAVMPYKKGGTNLDYVDLNKGTLGFSRRLFGWNDMPIMSLNAVTESGVILFYNRQQRLAFFVFAGTVLFSGLFILLLSLIWVYRPLLLVSSVLHTGNPVLIGSLQKKKDEFGDIARLIRKFFEQKDALVHEVEVRTRAQESLLLSEKTLRETEQKLRAIFDQTFQFIGLMTPEGVLIDANRAALELSGVELSSVLNKPFWETPWWTHSLPLQEKLRQAVKRAAEGEFIRFEATHIGKDGILHYVDFSLKPVKDEKGKVLFLIPEGRDLTERKNAEIGLNESREKYKRLVEGLKEEYFFYAHDTQGVFTYISPSITQILGYKAEEFLTHYGEYLTDNPINKEVQRHSDLSIQGISQPPYAVEIYHKDGSIRWLEVKESPVFNNEGKVVAVDGIAQDITRKREAEEALRAEKEKAQKYLDVAGVMLIVLDKEGKITLINKKGVDILEGREEEIIGKVWFDHFLPEKNKAQVKQVFQRLLAGEAAAAENFENEILTKGNKEKIISWHNTLLWDENMRITGILSSGEDITQQKKDEADLKEAYAKLRETQAQLIQAEKMEAVGRIATGIAHEVKNPLGIILQSINFLEEKFSSQGQKDSFEILQMMKENIKRADAIIHSLLDFSRASEFNMQPEDINAIIENSLILIQHKVKLENIEIIKDLKDKLPKVMADKGKMEQVFINLFLNAIQAMPGGGKLFMRSYFMTLDKIREAVGRRRSDYFNIGEKAVVVEVEDTGMGISKEYLNRVFEPFFTTKEPGSGTGLGLSVSNDIIAMHKGHIEIGSEEGKGTKVTIILKMPEEG